jgi:ParB-like chromosome segregation protein Spo0J
MTEYAYTYRSFPVDERAVAEALGVDYDDMLRYEQERVKLDPEVLAALDEVAAEVQRRMLGLMG